METIKVIVCTSHRGVFFGRTTRDAIESPTIRLEEARNCILWHRSIGGVLGLARTGPNAECRIGAVAPAITLRDVTAVIEVTDAAANAWEIAPCLD